MTFFVLDDNVSASCFSSFKFTIQLNWKAFEFRKNGVDTPSLEEEKENIESATRKNNVFSERKTTTLAYSTNKQ